MEKSFEEALGDLIAQYADEEIDDLITALELAIEVLEDRRDE